jgi:hypothetical protein
MSTHTTLQCYYVVGAGMPTCSVLLLPLLGPSHSRGLFMSTSPSGASSSACSGTQKGVQPGCEYSSITSWYICGGCLKQHHSRRASTRVQQGARHALLMSGSPQLGCSARRRCSSGLQHYVRVPCSPFMLLMLTA